MTLAVRSLSPVLLLALSSLLHAAPALNPVIAPHATELVVLQGDKLVPLDASRLLHPRFTVLYFGAGWCPDCRRFSPSLVAAYEGQDRNEKRFEVVLISQDQSAAGLLNFMKLEKMNWPALSFDTIASAADLQRYYSGHGIPCLTVLDPNGQVVLKSKDDQDAGEVLQQLLALVKRSG